MMVEKAGEMVAQRVGLEVERMVEAAVVMVEAKLGQEVAGEGTMLMAAVAKTVEAAGEGLMVEVVMVEGVMVEVVIAVEGVMVEGVEVVTVEGVMV